MKKIIHILKQVKEKKKQRPDKRMSRRFNLIIRNLFYNQNRCI